MGVAVAVALLYLPKLNTPQPPPPRAVVRSKIPSEPAVGKVKSPPAQQTQIQTATTAASVPGGAVTGMAKTESQVSPPEEKQAAAPVRSAKSPSVDNVLSPAAQAKSKAEVTDNKQADSTKVAPEVAAPSTSQAASKASQAKEKTVAVSQPVQAVVDSQSPQTAKQEMVVVQPLEPKPLPAKKVPETTAKIAAVAEPKAQTASPMPASSPKAKKTVKTEKTSAPPASSAPFTIQFGAFRTKAYADNLIADLQKRGYKPYLVDKMDANHKPLYLVRMGRFQTRIEVADAVARFKEKENMSAAVALTRTE